MTITTTGSDLGAIQIKANPEFTTEHKNKYGQDYVPPASTDYNGPQGTSRPKSGILWSGILQL